MRPRAVLLFDVCMEGFLRKWRKRLRLVGFECILSPYKDDDQILRFQQLLEEKRDIPVVIVTYDKRDFPRTRAIVLNIHDKFEEQITDMLIRLAERLRGRCDT